MLKTLDLKGWKHTAWCGPSAVAMITGQPVGHMHVRAAFLRQEKLTDVKAIYLQEAVLLLKEQGYRATPIDMVARYNDTAPTIKKFLADRTNYEFMMPIMFATHDHLMTAHMGFAGDNWTGKPVPIAEFPKLRRRVVAAFVVTEDYSMRVS
jgi:hypothetical protein